MRKISFSVKESRAVAICHLPKHRGYITPEAMKEHKCLEKNCTQFEKIEDAAYWKQKEFTKKCRKARKLLMNTTELIRADEKNIRLIIKAKEEVGEEMLASLAPNKDMLVIGSDNRIIGDDIGIKKTVERYRGTGNQQYYEEVDTDLDCENTEESEGDEVGARRNKVITGLESGKRNKYEDKKQGKITYVDPKNDTEKESEAEQVKEDIKVQEEANRKYKMYESMLESALKEAHDMSKRETNGIEFPTELAEEKAETEEKVVTKKKLGRPTNAEIAARKKAEEQRQKEEAELEKQEKLKEQEEELGEAAEDVNSDIIPISKESLSRIELYASLKLGEDVENIPVGDVVKLAQSEKDPQFTFCKLFGNNKQEIKELVSCLNKDYIALKAEADRIEKLMGDIKSLASL